MRATIAVSATLLAGCTTTGGPAAPRAADAIRYETSACYGTCPVYAVRVGGDGSAVFEGRRHTAVAGVRTFDTTPEQRRAFADALAPFRPATASRRVEPGSPDCGAAASDAPSVDVTWQGPDGERRLHVYLGCTSPEAQRLREAVRRAPDRLPIGAFVGARRPVS